MTVPQNLRGFRRFLFLLQYCAGVRLTLFFYLFVLSNQHRTLDTGLHLLISATTVALGFLAIMLGMNRLKAIPYWFVSSCFLLALTFLILLSDTPQQLLDGRATMFFMVPILLSGVLIHSSAIFIFTSIVTLVFAAFAMMTPGAHLNPLNIIFFYLFSDLVSMFLISPWSGVQISPSALQPVFMAGF
jgi:hypothetical protein